MIRVKKSSDQTSNVLSDQRSEDPVVGAAVMPGKIGQPGKIQSGKGVLVYAQIVEKHCRQFRSVPARRQFVKFVTQSLFRGCQKVSVPLFGECFDLQRKDCRRHVPVRKGSEMVGIRLLLSGFKSCRRESVHSFGYQTVSGQRELERQIRRPVDYEREAISRKRPVGFIDAPVSDKRIEISAFAKALNLGLYV